jgi:AcrR family transcriptional regulator
MPRSGLDPDAVVSAAADLADAEGLEALTLAKVASSLGVRSPSLYAHVDGLPDLRRRMAARGARELADALQAVAAGRAGEDALRAVADVYRSYAREHPGLYQVIQRAPDGDATEAQRVIDVILAVLRGYGLEGDDALHAVRAVRSALHGFVMLEQGGGFGLPIAIDDSFDRLVAALHRGLSG